MNTNGKKPEEPAPPASAWTAADTMAYLKANPLPEEFVWRRNDPKKHVPWMDQPLVPVRPTYSVPDYGKWLHDTPYFQGLFELIHDLLFTAPRLPNIATLTGQLNQIRREQEGQQTLF